MLVYQRVSVYMICIDMHPCSFFPACPLKIHDAWNEYVFVSKNWRLSGNLREFLQDQSWSFPKLRSNLLDRQELLQSNRYEVAVAGLLCTLAFLINWEISSRKTLMGDFDKTRQKKNCFFWGIDEWILPKWWFFKIWRLEIRFKRPISFWVSMLNF